MSNGLLEPTGTTMHEGERRTVGNSTHTIYQGPSGKMSESDWKDEAYETIRETNSPITRKRLKEGYSQSKQYAVFEYNNGEWKNTGETSSQLGGHTSNFESLPSFIEAGSTDWGAANISKEDFVRPDGTPRSMIEIASMLDPKLPGISGEKLLHIINDLAPQYQGVSQESLDFAAETEQATLAAADISMGTARDTYASDIYKLQSAVPDATATGKWSGSGAGARGAMQSRKDLATGFKQATSGYGAKEDAYKLAISGADLAERKTIFGLEEKAASDYETDLKTWFTTFGLEEGENWFTTGTQGPQVHDWSKEEGWRPQGYYDKTEQELRDMGAWNSATGDIMKIEDININEQGDFTMHTMADPNDRGYKVVGEGAFQKLVYPELDDQGNPMVDEEGGYIFPEVPQGREGGYIHKDRSGIGKNRRFNSETFLDVLTNLPDAGGS